jgi:hypothetical protein
VVFELLVSEEYNNLYNGRQNAPRMNTEGSISVTNNPTKVKAMLNPETVVTININTQCKTQLKEPTVAIVNNYIYVKNMKNQHFTLR